MMQLCIYGRIQPCFDYLIPALHIKIIGVRFKMGGEGGDPYGYDFLLNCLQLRIYGRIQPCFDSFSPE